MADTSLFGRLRRLFSNDVIIRNIGGNELKVADVNKIQTSGRYETNSLIDRFSRLYVPNSRNQYNPTLNYQTLRLQLYSDYEAMDTDAILASALDILSDEATVRNDSGDIVTIKSSDENIQRVLHNLFYDVLNIEFNLWSWTRNMCKYGDFFLKLEIAEKFGVYNVLPYTVYNVSRHEGHDKDNPNKVEFVIDPDGLAQAQDPSRIPGRQEKNIISETDSDKVESLAIYGHNPTLHALAEELLKKTIDKFPTCAMLYVRFETDKWANCFNSKNEVLFFDFPKNEI